MSAYQSIWPSLFCRSTLHRPCSSRFLFFLASHGSRGCKQIDRPHHAAWMGSDVGQSSLGRWDEYRQRRYEWDTTW